MKKLFIIAALAVVCTSVSAQFAKSKSASTAKSDGWSTIYLQYNPMTFNDDTGSGLGNLDYKGFTIGYNKAIGIKNSDLVFFEVGGAFSYARYKDNEESGDISTETKRSIFSLNIPVSLVFDLEVSKNVSILPFVGFNFRFNLMGKEKTEQTYTGDYENYEYVKDELMDTDKNLFSDKEKKTWERITHGNVSKWVGKLGSMLSYTTSS